MYDYRGVDFAKTKIHHHRNIVVPRAGNILTMVLQPRFSLANTNIAQNVQLLIQHPFHGLSLIRGTLIRLPARLPEFSVVQFSIVP